MRGEKGGAEEEEYGREEHVISKLDCSSILYRCICRRISGEVSNNPSQLLAFTVISRNM